MTLKRASALVDYSSGDDSDHAPHAPKRKKLPTLASTLVVAAPIDNPALHQGRMRSQPHVDGQWAAHVYVALRFGRKSALSTLLLGATKMARDNMPGVTLHNFGSEKGIELHISLSRPIFLRAHQREELRRAVKASAEESAPFTVSFASFSCLTNDERTRAFLAVEVGAGHKEFVRLSDSLKPLLEFLRQKTYYDLPRFHASIAWHLLANPSVLDATSSSADAVPSRLPLESMISSLNETYQMKLSAKSNFFEAESVSVKIGKEISTWRFKSCG